MDYEKTAKLRKILAGTVPANDQQHTNKNNKSAHTAKFLIFGALSALGTISIALIAYWQFYARPLTADELTKLKKHVHYYTIVHQTSHQAVYGKIRQITGKSSSLDLTIEDLNHVEKELNLTPDNQ